MPKRRLAWHPAWDPAHRADVARFGRLVHTDADVETLAAHAVDLLLAVLDCGYAEVLALSDSDDTLARLAGVGWDPAVAGSESVVARPETFAGFTLDSVDPVHVDDVRVETRFHAGPALLANGINSSVRTVVWAGGTAWGMLGVHATPTHWFHDEDVALVQAVANALGTAIDRRNSESGRTDRTKTDPTNRDRTSPDHTSHDPTNHEKKPRDRA